MYNYLNPMNFQSLSYGNCSYYDYTNPNCQSIAMNPYCSNYFHNHYDRYNGYYPSTTNISMCY